MLVLRALFWVPDPRLAAANLLRGPLTVPSAARREVPPALDSVVMKALARNPDERWPSADDMAEALDRFVGDAGQSQTDLAHIVSAITTHLPESSHWSETAPPPVATAPAATASQAQRAPVAPSVAPIAPVGPDVKPSGRRRVAVDEPTEQTDVGTRPYPQRRAGRRRAIDLGGPTLGRMATVALLAGAVGAAAVLLGQRWLGSEVTAVLPPAAGLRAAPQAPALALEPPGPAPGAAQPPPAIVPLPAAALELAAPVVAAPVRATGALVRSVAASPRRRGTSAGRHEGSSRRRSLGAAPAAGAAAPPAESRGSAKPNPF
jgi:serine/threonine-protein kinase